jgi:hypothetical protein
MAKTFSETLNPTQARRGLEWGTPAEWDFSESAATLFHAGCVILHGL